jgi:hypothetical protein
MEVAASAKNKSLLSGPWFFTRSERRVMGKRREGHRRLARSATGSTAWLAVPCRDEKRECRRGALSFDVGSKSESVGASTTPRLVKPNENGPSQAHHHRS